MNYSNNFGSDFLGSLSNYGSSLLSPTTPMSANPMAGFQMPSFMVPDTSGADPSAFGALDAQNNPAAASITPTGAADPGFLASLGGWMKDSGFLTSKNADGITTQGWGSPVLGAVQGIASGFMGMQQYNLAKAQLAQQKAQYDQNYAAQRQTVNTQLQDRQAARVASNPGAYQSVSDYMAANAIK